MPDNQAPPPVHVPPPQDSSEARTWNMLCHLSSLAGLIVPFGNIIGPLIVWQMKKNEFPSVEIHGKASLNFQITVMIAVLALVILGVLLSFICIGFLLFPVACIVGLAGIVLAIIAGVKANNGEEYHYPWMLELVK